MIYSSWFSVSQISLPSDSYHLPFRFLEVFSLKNIISNEQKQYGGSHQTKRSNPFFTYNKVLLLTVVPG